MVTDIILLDSASIRTRVFCGNPEKNGISIERKDDNITLMVEDVMDVLTEYLKKPLNLQEKIDVMEALRKKLIVVLLNHRIVLIPYYGLKS